ncbi:hypothetical protein LTR86_001988 [Recurvomyces mirabilis]|nr:hypothetical protein LTR86_001988 [Recurvomyces mirabilis]
MTEPSNKRRASTDPNTPTPVKKKRSQFFARSTTSVPDTTATSSTTISGNQAEQSNIFSRSLGKLRRKVSTLFHKMRLPHHPRTPDTLDGTASPLHRTATPPAPALLRFRRIRTSSSSNEHSLRPQRKRSVRFEGLSNDQLDGHHTDNSENMATGSGESRTSRISSKISDRIAALEGKLNGNTGTSTIVHRANMRKKASVPFINTNVPVTPEKPANGDHSPPGTISSSITSSSRNGDWSPASTTSTAATSLTSPGSSAGR